MNEGHHFFGRAASVKPQIVQVSCTQTGRAPGLRLARDCTSQAGGASSIRARSASDIRPGIPCFRAISTGMSRRWATSNLVIITDNDRPGLATTRAG